jgi:MFS family permease
MFKKIREFNRVILTMVTIDFFINGAFGIISPFFAIFITRQIEGGTATVAGFAASLYWITKSIIQLPVSRFLDKTTGERDEFKAFFFGYLFMAFIPIIYFFARLPWHIYLAQILFGIIMAWVVPAWYSIFTRHIDKFRISFEWSLYSVFSVGLATSAAAAIGGVLIDQFGFRPLFLAASFITFFSALGILSIKKYISPKDHLIKILPERKRHV